MGLLLALALSLLKSFNKISCTEKYKKSDVSSGGRLLNSTCRLYCSSEVSVVSIRTKHSLNHFKKSSLSNNKMSLKRVTRDALCCSSLIVLSPLCVDVCRADVCHVSRRRACRRPVLAETSLIRKWPCSRWTTPPSLCRWAPTRWRLRKE